MELIAFLLFVGLASLTLVAHKQCAKNKFRRSVETYEHARLRRISEGATPSSIPTVEEFLARRGELHLLAEIGKEPWLQTRLTKASLGQSPAFEASHHLDLIEHDSDDDYQSFVNEMWAIEGINLEGFILRRLTHVGPVECVLVSLVESTNRRLYLNLYEGAERKTYAADARHKWVFNDHEVDYSAFVGIMNGADPNIALKEDVYPQTMGQAASAQFDRFKTSDKKYVIAYRSEKGLSYRTISKVIRQEDRFSARCHFRWGERRTFLKHRLIGVFDQQTGREMNVETFLSKRN